MAVLNESFLFVFPPGWSGRQAPNIVTVGGGSTFDADIGFDVRALMKSDEVASSATATVSPSGPTIGTPTVSNDGYTVIVPVTQPFSVGAEHVITVVVTTTAGNVISKDGLVVVE